MSAPSDMILVGVDGELELYASADKKTGVVYNVADDVASDSKPLQVFFKWGNFTPPSATATVRAKGMARVSVGNP